MNLDLLNGENRFIISPDRPESPLAFPPLEFGSVIPVKLRVFEKGLSGLVAVDPSTYSVKLLVGTPNIRPTLGFWWISTTSGTSAVLNSRATKEDVAGALALAFGPVTVDGADGSYIVTVNAPGVWETPVSSFDGVTISSVPVFENTPGTATTSAQYRIEVLEVAPAGISTENWTAGNTSPESSFTQIQGRLWQLTIGRCADAGFFTLTIDGDTTEFISIFAGAYQIEMVLSVAGKPAQVQPDGVGGFYVMFSVDVALASIGGHVVAFPSVEGSLDLTSPGVRELLDGKQFTPVALTVVLSKNGQSDSFSTNLILQMPINQSAPPRYLTEDAGDSRYLHFLPSVTGYTGGGSANLDGIATVGLSIPRYCLFSHATDGGCIFRLRAGTDAENSPQIIHPLDYSTSNELVWEAISIAFFGGNAQ